MTYWFKIDNYQRIRKTVGSTEPLTLSEAKENLRIESGFTVDDTLITGMITAARTHVEDYCNRFFVESDVLVTADRLPSAQEPVYLPIPNIKSVADAFTYTDPSGDQQSFSGTLALDSDFQTITPSLDWPEGSNYKFTLTVEPPVNISAVKQAMQLVIADMYEHRTKSIVGTIVAENPAFRMLLAPYRAELSV